MIRDLQQMREQMPTSGTSLPSEQFVGSRSRCTAGCTLQQLMKNTFFTTQAIIFNELMNECQKLLPGIEQLELCCQSLNVSQSISGLCCRSVLWNHSVVRPDPQNTIETRESTRLSKLLRLLFPTDTKRGLKATLVHGLQAESAPLLVK